MGFSTKWCNWVRFCYSTASFSVLINGSSFGYFKISREVSQGDPISSLLFNIAMKGFSRYLDRATDLKLFSGFSCTQNGIIINHLHYADDTIFLLHNSKVELHNLFSALHYFEYIACLKINTTKTRLIPICCIPKLDNWATELGFSTDSIPFMYLGLPFGAKSNSKATWDPVLNKFDTRLSFWNQISLSKGALYIYFLDIYKLDRGKFTTLAEHISLNGNWCFNFKRRLSYFEANQYASMLHLLGDNPPLLDSLADTRRWELTSDGVFNVTFLYGKLNLLVGVDNFPHSLVWKKNIPPKVNFLIWCAVHGRLNIIDVLAAKCIILEDGCIMYGDAFESADHIFLHCRVATWIWSQLTPNNWAWPFPRTLYDLARCWNFNLFSPTGNHYWPHVPYF
ncbi:uncharacterized protein LOC113280491 [Papaver somniferum]|uniref:uncharacterized protein LOC113280491 n=1 Tax=Papaver somniferum TaxID=3469 RepID=UPI000E6FCB4B|nr:uncharacterized protein LOC113280491 [Papaver somniferum]